MNMYVFCPLWGNETDPFPDLCHRMKKAGYDGIEMPFPMNKFRTWEYLRVLKDYDLKFIAQHCETNNPVFPEHRAEYERRLWNLVETDPLFINSQTGRDIFSFDQNCDLIAMADQISSESGIPIYHETHRGKFSFAAHEMKKYLEDIPGLKITMDISHWCTVAESLLDDQVEAVQLAISRTRHIHARIGHQEGPQVLFPFDDFWIDILQVYLNWWDKIFQKSLLSGSGYFSVTCETGPFPYMIINPFLKKEMVSQWDENLRMKDFLLERYKGIGK